MNFSIYEVIMLTCFGISWPFAIVKTIRAKNPAGKSVAFLWLIIIGYLAGMASKIASGNIDWVIGLYALNTLMVATDLGLVYFYRARNAAAETGRK